MTRWQFLLAASLAAVAPIAAAHAQDADVIVGATSDGRVGERYDGYLGIVTSASPALRRQVAAINIRRRSLYSGLASSRGATPQEVGVAASCTLLGRVAVGGYYLLGTGVWQRRQAGQAAPRPEYCR